MNGFRRNWGRGKNASEFTHESPTGVVIMGIILCSWFLVLLIDRIQVVIRFVKAAITRVLSREVISIRKMGLEIKKCNVCCPCSLLGRNLQVTSSVVSIGKPHERVFLSHIRAQVFPLCVELNAIIEDIVSKIDVLAPGCWIACMPIKGVLSHPTIQMITLRNTHYYRKNRGFVPSGLAKGILQLGDVDIGWDIIKK